MLEAQRLTKRFGTILALDELTLTVHPGEITCLLGANGAGKTTAINLFLGLLEPTSGTAAVDGVDVRRAPLESKRTIAYIPEQVALYRSLTGVENLRFFSSLSGLAPRSTAPLYELLEQVGIDRATADRRVSGYSKGMRQKVGIAAALAKEATSLLLDEPLSGLDPRAANEFVRILEDLREGGVAVLMATHDIFRSREIATRIGIMRAGRLVDEIEPKALRHDELEALYLRHMREDDRSAAKETS